jgi:K+-sensing histidine kinase KdpD
MRRSAQQASDRQLVSSALGSLVAIAAAGVLVSVRGTIDNTNIALVMVVVVVAAAAAGGRTAGAVTAVVATMAFDFFHTKPYLSLTIESADDIETTILLLLIGLLVGQLALVGWRRRADATEGRGEVSACTGWPSWRLKVARRTT